MTLAAGTRLGPYEIVAPLGAGGMGEVYRARDTRLKREVAIKILRAGRGDEAALLQRLEQEARTIAALNHPNLVAIHDLGEYQGAPFLVMELLEGETLRARLGQGPLPLRRALDCARQLAQGLAAAHGAGIIHRDLKPENIILTPAGRLKILDFGLAKSQVAGEQETMGATAAGAAPVTAMGTVLGTVGYMAPEQVRGEPAAAPADIFAFGAILYEMLAGRRAFQAETSAEAMTAILREDPPEISVGAVPLPPTLDRIIRRCLEKAPAQRFQSAADLDFALSAVADSSGSSSSVSPAALPAQRARRWRVPLAFAAALTLAVFLCALLMLDRGVPSLATLSVRPLALNARGDHGQAYVQFWSPDGSALAYANAPDADQPRQIFLYRPGAAAPLQLTSWAHDTVPVGWSADSQNIFVVTDTTTTPKVWSVAAVGGEPRPVLDLGHPAGGVLAMSANSAAVAVLLAGPDGKLSVAYSAPPGAPLRWYAPHPFAVTALGDYPTLLFSPDGKQLLLSLPDAMGPIRTWLLPFPPGPQALPRQILSDLPPHDYSPKFAWLANGHLLLTSYVESGGSTLWDADPASGRLRLLAAHVTYGYQASPFPGGDGLSLSRVASDLDVVSVDLRTGAVLPTESSLYNEEMPAWAKDVPDMVYTTDRDGADEIWIREGGSERMLLGQANLPGGGMYQLPTLSPDARRIAYTTLPTGRGNQPVPERLWLAAVAGGPPVVLTATGSDFEYQSAPCWSPDGNWIAYLSTAGPTNRLMVTATTGNAVPRVLKPVVGLGSLVDMAGLAWSPDGKWIAYQATDGLVHLIAPDGGGDHIATSTRFLVWTFAADSQSLYGIVARGANAALVAVSLPAGALRTIANLGTDFPASQLQPGYQLTLAPDGNTVTYGTGKTGNEIDLVQPFSVDGAGMARLRRWLHLP